MRLSLAALTALSLMLVLLVAAAPATAQYPGGGYGHWDGNDDGSDEGDDNGDDDFDDDESDGNGNPVQQELPPEPQELPTYTPPKPKKPAGPKFKLVTTPTVSGNRARLRTDGRAAIPRGAPKRVREIIAAANRIIGKPYKWGGGHARLRDRGYDCSGAVSYALIVSGNLRSPLVSGTFARWGGKGAARWVSIYANRRHVYMEVAGLRLDTSRAGDPSGRSGVRWRPTIARRKGFEARHLPGR